MRTTPMVEHEEAHAPPAEPAAAGRTPAGSDASRRNSLRDGCRARVIFPPQMAAAINERMARLTERLQPDGELEEMIVHEIARSGAQMDVCHDQMIQDHIRVDEKTDSDWHADRTREANRLGARIATDPLQVAGQLEESLHGVNRLLYNWRSLL